uniref:Uncharacterized protein n=1 Tax=Athene cunicularia TaxID=194338 RepID=A0A663NB70_ATHCN
MANTRLLSLCAYSRVTGLAVEARAGVSHVTSSCLGQTLGWQVAPSQLPAQPADPEPSHPAGLKALRKTTVTQLKKQCCCVSINYEGDFHNQGYHHPARFQAPDGQWITLDKGWFYPKLLFQPKLLHQRSPGLHHVALQSFQKLPDHTRRGTVCNTTLSGSSSAFPGFSKRMCLELNMARPATSTPCLDDYKRIRGCMGGSSWEALPSCHSRLLSPWPGCQGTQKPQDITVSTTRDRTGNGRSRRTGCSPGEVNPFP